MILMLSVAACGTTTSQTDTEPTAVAQVQPTPTTAETVAPVATEAPAEPTATEAPAVVETPTPVPPGCYPEPITNLIDLTKNSKIAPVSADEWQSGGPDSAPITVIEYSDFQ